MGVDTIVRFPAGTQVRDVADVIAVLLGKPQTWHDIPSKAEYEQPTASGWCTVKGIAYRTSDTQPECCTILIDDIPPAYGEGWWFFYHFEGEHGGPLMMGRSRAERIALHRRLCQHFGGTVDYNDCDAKDVNLRIAKPAWLGRTHKDEHFHAKEIAQFNLAPISREEIDECRQWASYK